MENEQPPATEPEVTEERTLSKVHSVTPLSKYLAMILFVALPFIGGWVGYTYAPGKVIEVERVVMVEKEIEVPVPDVVVVSEPDSLTSTETDEILFNPDDLVLNTSIFMDDMKNRSLCLSEWDEVKFELPAEVNNQLRSMSLNVFAEELPPRVVQIKSFSLNTVDDYTTAEYTHRWQFGASDVSNKIIPNQLYRYRLRLFFDNPDNVAYAIERSIETEPFVVVDCGV